MKRSMLFTGLIALSLFGLATAKSDKTVELTMGLSFPRDLLDRQNSAAGDGTFKIGAIMDNIVGIGASLDFSWNVLVKERDSLNHYITTFQERSYMFPVSMYLSIDPLYFWIVHPVLTVTAGFNQMIYYHDPVDSLSTSFSSSDYDNMNGYYFGPFIKLGLSGLYDLGEHVSITLGTSYQWREFHRNVHENRDFTLRKSMSGMGLYAGFRFRI